MAKKINTPVTTPKAVVSKAPLTAAPISSTPVRNSAIPPRPSAAAPFKRPAPTQAEIALKAYYLWKQNGGSQDSNWFRAERELRGA